jgi:GTPase SAR1 family protein
MELRIGTTLEGRPAGFDTGAAAALVLVGDPGRGKTTWARYVTRWWTAETTHHAHVFAARPQEWADLRCYREDIAALTRPVATGCSPGSCLVVVDDLEQGPAGAVGLLPFGRIPTVLTCCGGNLEELEQLEGGCTCLGLLGRGREFPREIPVIAGQGRLDWPSGTVAVVPDQRGSQDFPCHRWHTPPAATGAAR